jgi:predicted HicB family RNase H-like nuclease
MNSMQHQGYTARIEYDERDNIFAGRLLGIRAIIGFHGQTVKALRKAFEHAVEDCLAACSENGSWPEKPASGRSFNQWLSESLQSAGTADA